jgi:hypothetical protein
VKGGIRVGPLDRPCKGAKAEGGSAGRGVPCEWGRVSGVTSRRGEVEEKSHPLTVWRTQANGVRRETVCTGRNFILSDVVPSPKEERRIEKRKRYEQGGAAVQGRDRLEAEGTPRVV